MDKVIHGIGALLIVLAILWCYWLSILAFGILGYRFEQAQHRHIIDADNKVIGQYGFFDLGWMNWHRALEAAAWMPGALIACLVWRFVHGS